MRVTPTSRGSQTRPVADAQTDTRGQIKLQLLQIMPCKGALVVKKKRVSLERLVSVLKETMMGAPAADLIRKVGVSEQTF